MQFDLCADEQNLLSGGGEASGKTLQDYARNLRFDT